MGLPAGMCGLRVAGFRARDANLLNAGFQSWSSTREASDSKSQISNFEFMSYT